MLCTIVGVGGGLGAAIARRFNAEGYAVALVARDRERLLALRAGLPHPEEAAVFTADAGSPDALRAALAAAHEWRGSSDVLVYNAARLVPDEVATLTPQRLSDALSVDVGGALTSIEAVLPGMRSAGRGTILLTGGGLAHEPYPEWASLAAGKAALRSIGLGLHKSLLPEGIHAAVVTVAGLVAPGTPFDPDVVAGEYWRLHTQPAAEAQREVVFLPEGADPFYNDPEGLHRASSEPVRAIGMSAASDPAGPAGGVRAGRPSGPYRPDAPDCPPAAGP